MVRGVQVQITAEQVRAFAAGAEDLMVLQPTGEVAHLSGDPGDGIVLLDVGSLADETERADWNEDGTELKEQTAQEVAVWLNKTFALQLAVVDAVAAATARDEAEQAAQAAAITRAHRVAKVVELCGSQTQAANLLRISQPTVADLVRKAKKATESVAEYDVVVVTRDNDNYPAREFGKLALQRAGQFVAFVPDLDQAAVVIERLTGCEITLTEAESVYFGKRWAAALVGADPAAGTGPAEAGAGADATDRTAG